MYQLLLLFKRALKAEAVKVALALIISLSLVPSLFADTVTMRNGEIIQGKIIGQNQTRVRIQTSQGLRVVQKAELLRITYGETPEEKEKIEEQRKQEQEKREAADQKKKEELKAKEKEKAEEKERLEREKRDRERPKAPSVKRRYVHASLGISSGHGIAATAVPESTYVFINRGLSNNSSGPYYSDPFGYPSMKFGSPSILVVYDRFSVHAERAYYEGEVDRVFWAEHKSDGSSGRETEFGLGSTAPLKRDAKSIAVGFAPILLENHSLDLLAGTRTIEASAVSTTLKQHTVIGTESYQDLGVTHSNHELTLRVATTGLRYTFIPFKQLEIFGEMHAQKPTGNNNIDVLAIEPRRESGVAGYRNQYVSFFTKTEGGHGVLWRAGARYEFWESWWFSVSAYEDTMTLPASSVGFSSIQSRFGVIQLDRDGPGSNPIQYIFFSKFIESFMKSKEVLKGGTISVEKRFAF